jgi:nitrogen fixation NifU-like protein
MYREEILEHYRRPRNSGTPDGEGWRSAEGENPSCGDSMKVFVKTEDGRIAGVKHETDACAIATAAVSILSDELVGREVDEVKNLDRQWVTDLLEVEVSPMRVKCAVLGLRTVQSALEDSG